MLQRFGVCFLLVVLISTSFILAADNKVVTAIVTADKPEAVKGLPVRVLQRNEQRGGLVRINEKETYTLHDSGSVSIDLPAGVYVFEILHLTDDNTIYALLSPPTDITKGKPAVIAFAEPAAVTLTHDKQPMDVSQIAVRSAAVRGEVRWKHDALIEQTPRLAMSAQSTSMVNVIGSARETHVAAWLRLDPRKGATFATKPDWNTCQFSWLPKSPGTTAVIANLGAPDVRLEIAVTPEAKLITNRRFWMVGYTATLTDGPVLKFRSVGRNITRMEKLEFGGPELTPHAWATNLWHDSGTFHFTWRYGLLDSAGRMVDVNSESGITATIARVDGKPVPKNQVEEAERKELGDLTQSLKVAVKWTWARPMEKTISPEPTVELRSQRFKIEAVPFWIWQTQNYLTKMERYHKVEQLATGRPGPASVNLDWRYNIHNAKATVGAVKGGGKWLWMSLPFHGYEANHEPWSQPGFTGHEMLHNFGYHHGDEMAKMQDLVEANFADSKWRMVDNPPAELPIEQATPMNKPGK